MRILRNILAGTPLGRPDKLSLGHYKEQLQNEINDLLAQWMTRMGLLSKT